MTTRQLAFSLLGVVAPLNLLMARAKLTVRSQPPTPTPTSSPSTKSILTPPKVLIGGAGISGPAAAFWLPRAGCEITVVDRSSKLRATGQQIDPTGQGIVILGLMGIEDAVRAVRCPEPGMRMLDHQGRSKAFFPINTGGKGLSPIRELEVMREDLVRILYEATKEHKGVKYMFDSHIKTFTQDVEGSPAGKIHITFSHGGQDDYDVLIGADGSGSATRKLMLGRADPDPRRSLGVDMAFRLERAIRTTGLCTTSQAARPL